MTMTHLPGPVDTFLDLYTRFPSLSADLLALWAQAPMHRVWVRDAACFVHPSANGEHWDYELGGTGPNLNTSVSAKWPGPMGITTFTTSTNVLRDKFKGLIYRMPQYKARSISDIMATSNGATVGSGGTDAFDLRIYPLGPNFEPLAVAPIHVIKFNAGGTGGAVAKSLVIGAGVANFYMTPAAPLSLPGLCVIGMIHAFFPTTMPAFYVPSLNTQDDGFPRNLSAGLPTASATLDRTAAFTWDETFAAGATTVWGSVGSPDMSVNTCPAFNLKLV